LHCFILTPFTETRAEFLKKDEVIRDQTSSAFGLDAHPYRYGLDFSSSSIAPRKHQIKPPNFEQAFETKGSS
jgi:hypothetical protein